MNTQQSKDHTQCSTAGGSPFLQAKKNKSSHAIILGDTYSKM